MNATNAASPEHQVYEVGGWEISPSTCTVRKRSGLHYRDPVKITPLSMSVLEYLCERPGVVVSCAEFRTNIWRSPVGSDHAVHKAIAELRNALGDQASEPRFIKTIPRRGYCLISQVEAILDETPDVEPGAVPWRRSSHAKRWIAAAACLVVVMLISSAWLYQTRGPATAEGTPTLAVLPFLIENYSDSDQILAEGIRESLVHGLSEIGNLRLVSPVSNPAVHESLRDELVSESRNADHLLHGRVFSSPERLRVIIQLVRLRDGIQLYSDQFDLEMDDIFRVQDEIASNVVSALRVHLDEGERSRMLDWGTSDALAYERFLRGNFHYNQSNPVDFERAMDFYTQAIEYDPEFLHAYHGVAISANRIAFYGDREQAREMYRRVLQMHRAVTRLAPDSDIIDSINTIKLRMQGDNHFQHEGELRRQVLEGSPPHYALAHYAMWLIGARMYDEAMRMLDAVEELPAFEISPDSVWNYRYLVLPHAETIPVRMRQLQQRPYHIGFLGAVAINLAFLGDFRKAEVYLTQQESVDISGVLTHKTRTKIDFLAGRLPPGSEALEQAYGDAPEFDFNNGALAFMAGNMERGVEYWSDLEPGQLRRLIDVAHSSEYFFPDEVLESQQYHDLLESLGAGKTWQRTLMEGVMAMEPITGVGLHPDSRAAYEEGRFMIRNNLWSEREWRELEQNRSGHAGAIVLN